MKLQRLIIENFGLFEGNHRLEFDNGILFVEGENRDDSMAESNASGKSTLIGAIGWCLTGKTADGKGYDNIISKGTNRECSVALVFDNNLVIERNRGFSKGGSICLFPETPKSRVINQDELDTMLSLDKDWFYSSIFLGQDFISFYDLKPTARKDLLMAFLPVDILNQLDLLCKKTKNELNLCKDDRIKTDTTLKILESSIDDINQKIFDQRELADRFDDEQKQRLIALEGTYTQKIICIKKELKELNKNNVENPIETHTLQMMELHESLSVRKEDYKDLCLDKEKVVVAVTSIINEINNDKKHINDLQKDVVNISNLKGKCPLCKTLVTEKNKNKCIDEINSEIKLYENSLKTKQQQSEKILKRKELIYSDENKLLKNIETLEHNIRNLTNSIQNEERKQSEIKIKQNKLQSDLDTAKKIYDMEMQNIANQKNIYLSKIKDLKKELLDTQFKIKESNKFLQEIDKDEENLNFILDMSGNTGIKSRLFDQFVDELQQSTDFILEHVSDNISVEYSTLKEHKKGTVSESFDIIPYENGEISLGLSGGQKQKVRVAVSLALSEILNKRKTNVFDFMILDEPHRGLDRIGQEKLFELLQNMHQTGKRSQIVVTSPQSDFRSMFDKTIKVVRENNRSHIE